MAGAADIGLPEELRRSFAQGELIVCLGPQGSEAVGLPSRAALAKQLVERAAERDAAFDAKGLDTRIGAGRIDEVLELVRRTLGAAFVHEVQTLLSDQGKAPPPLLEALAQHRDGLRAVYTVRQDRLLERAFAGQWPSFAEARSDLAQRRGVLFKMMGTLELPATWVLTQSQVDRELGPGAPRREAFATAYRAHQMLFIGFASDDPDVSRLLDLRPAADHGEGPGHFIVAPGCATAERALLAGRGLEVIDADPIAVLDAIGTASAPLPTPKVDACPYPGQAPFDEAMAPVFFGRHVDVSNAASRIGPTSRWLAVVGPDGIGKTSFIHAGVVPALRRGFSEVAPERWLIATMHSDATPRAALVDCLTTALGMDDPHAIEQALADSATQFAECVALHTPPQTEVLLIVDPFEELLESSDGDRITEALAAALERSALHLVTTHREAEGASFGGLAEQSAAANRHRLRALGRMGLRDAIVEPAALAGARVEPTLVDALIEDAAEALPVIAQTMAGLWTDAVLADKVLTAVEYRATGGAAGAMRRHAERTVKALPAADREAAIALLKTMVRREADSALSSRPASWDAARDEDPRIVDALVEARVLTVQGNPQDRILLLPHASLLAAWPPLREPTPPLLDARPDAVDAAVPTRLQSTSSPGPGRWLVPTLLGLGAVGAIAFVILGRQPDPPPGPVVGSATASSTKTADTKTGAGATGRPPEAKRDTEAAPVAGGDATGRPPGAENDSGTQAPSGSAATETSG
ncbi:MAG: SIR2 family protein, partial [Myxococcota bacterium]